MGLRVQTLATFCIEPEDKFGAQRSGWKECVNDGSQGGDGYIVPNNATKLIRVPSLCVGWAS